MRVAIIGAGAAGLATAIFAARRNPEFTITLLESAKKPGAKILVSGGGRCNVTNVNVTEKDFFGGSPNSIRRVLRSFPADKTVEFFRELGVPLHEEQWGKLFPDSNKARTVLDALLGEVKKCGVEIRRQRVDEVLREGTEFRMDSLRSDRVVLATGGKSLPKSGSRGGGYVIAESLGHSILPQTPGLEPLLLDGDFHVGLSGVAHEAEISVFVEGGKTVRLQGPMLWTHFGISGPVPMNASRLWHRARLEEKPVRVEISFLPGATFESAEKRLMGHPSKITVQKAVASDLPARVAGAVLSKLGITGTTTLAHLGREERRKLLRGLLNWEVPVVGGRGWDYAEVTAGGVPLDEIDSRTMESRKCPGLFFVGEILDVDGLIGGYNFQWSWSSAWVAAAGLSASGEGRSDAGTDG